MALGYLSESSGVMHERTAAALKAFQESNGLPADGIAGPNTQQALYDGGCHSQEADPR